MRSIDANLLTGQKTLSGKPVFNLTFGTATAYDATTFLLEYTYNEPGRLTIVLDNSAGTFNTLPAKLTQGAQVELKRGMTIEGTDYTAELPRTWVEEIVYDYGKSRSTLVIECIDWWEKLRRWHATAEQSWAATSVTTILEWILDQVGLTRASGTMTALSLDFTISKGESGATAINRLMAKMPEYLYAGLDGEVKWKEIPGNEASTYTYGWNAQHPVLDHEGGETAWHFNTVVVDAQGGTYTGSATDATQVSNVGTRQFTIPDAELSSNAECTQRAEAELDFYEAGATETAITARPTHGLEQFDVVTMDDPGWGGDDLVGRIIGYSERYGPGVWQQIISTGIAAGKPNGRAVIGSSSLRWIWNFVIETIRTTIENFTETYITSGILLPKATTTVQGIVELATNAEAITGTDTERAITPAGLATHTDRVDNPHQVTATQVDYTAGKTVAEILDETLNSGVLHDITITDDGGLNISWSVCEIWDAENDTEVDTDSGSDTCTNNVVNYLIWTSGSTLTLATTKANPANNEIGVAEIACQEGDIWHIQKDDRLHRRTYEISEALEEMFPTIVTSGVLVSEDTNVTNTWDVSLSAGTYYLNGHERHTIAAPVLSRTTAMVRWYKVAGVWTSDTNAEIDNTQWIDGAGLSAVTANRYYRSHFFIVEETIHWVYPDTEHVTLAQALGDDSLAHPPGLAHLPNSTSLILRGNAAAFPTAGGEQWIDIRPTITSSVSASTSDHGNLAGLPDDDHAQYLLVNGTRAMTGALDMGNQTITNNTGITFTGASGANIITAPDNVAQALSLMDAGGWEYLRIVSTNTQPQAVFNPSGQDIDFTVQVFAIANALQILGNTGQVTLGALGAGIVQSTAGGVLSSSPATSDGAANHNTILASSAAGAITMDDYFTVDGGVFGIAGNELLTVNAAGTFAFSGIVGITIEDNDWIGLGAAAGRIEFDDLATDEINFLNCKVGINTSTPQALLQLGGTLGVWADNRLVVQNTGAPTVITIGEDADNRGWMYWDDAADQLNFSSKVGGGNFLDTVVIDSGNVGIRTTAPDGTLHVHTATAGAVAAAAAGDDLVVENSGSGGISILVPDANRANLFFGSLSDNVGALIQWGHDIDLMRVGTSKAGAELAFETAAAAEAMRIDSSGLVGVGVTVPGAQLHVDQSSASGARPALTLDQADVSEQCIQFTSDSADRDINLWTVDVTGTPTSAWDESEDSFSQNKGLRITSGSLGIGEISPTRHLQVNSDTTNIPATFVSTDPVCYITFSDDTTTSDSQVGVGAIGDNLKLYAGATAKATLDSNGRFGIGAPATIDGMVHIQQPSVTGNIPVIVLNQADIDKVLAKIIGTAAAASVDRTLVADSDFGTPGALAGWIQVEIQDDGNRVADGDYYIPFYAAPS